MADQTRTVDIIFRGQNQLGTALVPIQQGLGGIGEDAQFAEDAVGGLGDQVGNLDGSPRQSVLSLSSALQALAASVVVKEFIEANVAAENFHRAMTLITDSSEQAADEFEYLKSLSNTLGLTLLDVTDSYVSLSAATQGTALEGQQTREVFEAISIAMSVLGKSSADTEGALQAVTQIVSKGVVSMEELRQQLGERVPRAFQIAADSMGLTTQELNVLVASGELLAEDFLPKFAAGMKDAFGDVQYVDTYTAAMGRLKNSIDEAAINIGEGGGFDGLTKLLQTGTVAVLGLYSAFDLLGTNAGLFFGAIADFIDDGKVEWNELGNSWVDAVDRAVDRIKPAGAALLGMEEAGRQVDDALREVEVTVERWPSLFEGASQSISDIAKASKETNKILKELGVDPDQLEKPIEAAIQALETLINIDGVAGDDIFKGLLVALSQLEGATYLPHIEENLNSAFENGSLDVDNYRLSIEALKARGDDLAGSGEAWAENFERQAESLQKSTDASAKAEEQAEKTHLEFEKLASNERIANIEAAVTLDVANLEADTERAVAIIDGLSETISGTAELLGDLFGNLIDADSLRDKFAIEDQIELENERREEQLELQKKLTLATIAEMNARRDRLNDGGAIITVNGDGLQPHLEAFMWEILQQIQTRVNSDGYELLLGAGT